MSKYAFMREMEEESERHNQESRPYAPPVPGRDIPPGSSRHLTHLNELHWQLALQVAKVGIWEWDLRRNQMQLTPLCKGIFGLAPEAEANYEEVLGQIHPQDRQHVEHMITTSLQENTAYNTEYRVIWPDGSMHWVAARGKGIYDRRGQALRMIGVVLDMTTQKQAEESQKEAERNMLDLLTEVSEGCGHTNQAYRITYINARAERQGAVSMDKAIGRTVWEVYPEFVGSVVEHCYHQVMQTRHPAHCEFYNAHLQTWSHFHLSPARDGGITVFIKDITERKHLEQEREDLLKAERTARMTAEAAYAHSEQLVKQLERQQVLLRAILEQAPCGIVVADAPSGNILFTSQEYQRLTEPSVQQGTHALNAPLEATTAPEDMPAEKIAALAHACMTDTMPRHEELCWQKNGQPVHMEVSAAPVHETDGQIIAGIATVHDVSERYEMERRKDELMCMANHELRTPLTALTGHLQLLNRRLKRLLGGEHGSRSRWHQEEMEQLARCAGQALCQARVECRLLNALSDAMALQSGRLGVVLAPCDLVRVVCETLDELRPIMGTHSLDLECPQSSEIPVLADPIRLGQVVTNYVTNALKYSADAQPVRVGISLTEEEARVWVKDQGPGLSPEAQQRIWDQFSPLMDFSAYTSRGGGGLGLGLYLSRALIGQHGGRVGVESAPGKGSTFWLSLPRSR